MSVALAARDGRGIGVAESRRGRGAGGAPDIARSPKCAACFSWSKELSDRGVARIPLCRSTRQQVRRKSLPPFLVPSTNDGQDGILGSYHGQEALSTGSDTM